MLTLGLLGDDYETLAVSEEYKFLKASQVIDLVSKSSFAGKLISEDKSVIEETLHRKFPETEAGKFTIKNTIALLKGLMMQQQIVERQKAED